MNEVQVFKALGDPTRLQIVKRLSKGNSLNMTTISYELGITRQGVRKHIQVLIDAKVIHADPKGRDTIVTLNPVVLDKARKFIFELEKQWDQRLDSLKKFTESKK